MKTIDFIIKIITVTFLKNVQKRDFVWKEFYIKYASLNMIKI